MSDVEIMVILILFPVLSSYSRFVELEKEVALCLALVVKGVLLGKCTGIISTTASRSGTSATCRTSGASSAGTGDISARPFSRCSSSTEYSSSRACATI